MKMNKLHLHLMTRLTQITLNYWEIPFKRDSINNNEVDNSTLRFAVATHDSKLIEHTIRLWKTSKIRIENFEFEFLKGIRDELKRDL